MTVPGQEGDPLLIALFSEIVTTEQLMRNRVSRALPEGMELSHFMLLNHFARLGGEKTPAQLARLFHLTRPAMTNTLRRLEARGYVHIRPDWEDARQKRVSISRAGQDARDQAVAALSPILAELAAGLGAERIRAALPLLRALRRELERPDKPRGLSGKGAGAT